MKDFKVFETTNVSKKSEICQHILRSLPEWFGIEKAILDYMKSVAEMKMWTLYADDVAIGFIAVRQHNSSSAEIHVMGLLKEYHNLGYGKKLVQKAENYLSENNFKFLTVKTLSDSHPDHYYKLTRKFYLKY